MSLPRELRLFDAVMMGLGSILGTGVYVSIALAAGIAGPGLLLAIALAGLLAACNGLSSAQLAARHPVSGGTYEYGYRRLTPLLGFAAGWMFLCAKAASAATASLGFAGYLLSATGGAASWAPWLGLATAIVVSCIVLVGVRISSRVNIAIVSLTLCSLAAFVLAGLPAVTVERLSSKVDPSSCLHAAALMFVAFAGYGRIATLGEEVLEPERTIPRAIVLTLLVTTVIYLAVGGILVASGTALRTGGGETTAASPLEHAARGFPVDVHRLVALGAMTAMLGVLLNLVLGLSRVCLAMGRRGDLPWAFGNVHVAVVAAGAVIAALTALGSVKVTWSFSAFTILIYYAVTNLAALRLAPQERLFARTWAWSGLAGCLLLAFSIDRRTWGAGLAVLIVGIAWHSYRRLRTGAPMN